MDKFNDTAQRAQARSSFVPSGPVREPFGRDLPTVHMPAQTYVDLLPAVSHTGHARQDDDAMSHAKAALLVSAAYIAAAAMITAGLLLIAYLFRALGDGWGTYTFTGLIMWGVCVLATLWGNRRQSLHHSPTGISHHEIDSRERIALHAIDTHADLLIKRWEMDRHDK